MNSSVISLVAMNLTPLITPFSQSIGMILSKAVTFLVAMVTNSFGEVKFLYAGLYEEFDNHMSDCSDDLSTNAQAGFSSVFHFPH